MFYLHIIPREYHIINICIQFLSGHLHLLLISLQAGLCQIESRAPHHAHISNESRFKPREYFGWNFITEMKRSFTLRVGSSWNCLEILMWFNKQFLKRKKQTNFTFCSFLLHLLSLIVWEVIPPQKIKIICKQVLFVFMSCTP